MADLEDYARSFWSSATAEVMIYGNYERDVCEAGIRDA